MHDVALMALAVVITTLASGVRLVPRGFTGLVERRGSFHRRLRWRLGWVVPGLDEVTMVDLREHRGDLGPLPLRSHDALPLVASVSFRYQVVEPVRATYRAQSVLSSIEHLARHELRMMMAGLPSEAILDRGQVLNGTLAAHLGRAETAWGIRVDDVSALLRRFDEYDVGQRTA